MTVFGLDFFFVSDFGDACILVGVTWTMVLATGRFGLYLGLGRGESGGKSGSPASLVFQS